MGTDLGSHLNTSIGRLEHRACLNPISYRQRLNIFIGKVLRLSSKIWILFLKNMHSHRVTEQFNKQLKKSLRHLRDLPRDFRGGIPALERILKYFRALVGPGASLGLIYNLLSVEGGALGRIDTASLPQKQPVF